MEKQAGKLPEMFYFVNIASDFQGGRFASQLMYGNMAICAVYEMENGNGKYIRVVSEHFDLRFAKGWDEKRESILYTADKLGKLITESLGYPLELFY